jgi:hypothetical protein
MLAHLPHLLPSTPETALGWAGAILLIATGHLRLRRDRARTAERVKLAELRIAHAERTGDFTVLEEDARGAQAARMGRRGVEPRSDGL